MHKSHCMKVLVTGAADFLASRLLAYAEKSEQLIVMQHIGGMTKDAQEIAYGHAAWLLERHFG